MGSNDRRRIAWFADSPAEIISDDALALRLKAGGWDIIPTSADDEADYSALPVLDLRSGLSPAYRQVVGGVAGRVSSGQAGACVAVVSGPENGATSVPSIQELIAAGVSHILYWPAADDMLCAALEPAAR